MARVRAEPKAVILRQPPSDLATRQHKPYYRFDTPDPKDRQRTPWPRGGFMVSAIFFRNSFISCYPPIFSTMVAIDLTLSFGPAGVDISKIISTWLHKSGGLEILPIQ